VPLGLATASFTVHGAPFTMAAAQGYHDKAFGPLPIDQVVRSWYAGHARLGPYSLVWIDAVLAGGAEQTTVYVGRGDAVLVAACGPATAAVARVRPWGRAPGSAFPPPDAASPPGGFVLEAETRAGRFVANMTVRSVITQGGTLFERFLGPIVGGIEGQETVKGAAYFEQFVLQ
jgi:hypothetical protein